MPADPPQPTDRPDPAPAENSLEQDERNLDAALESTFPASDPVAAEAP